MSHPPVLARGFYQRPTEVVAAELLGKLLYRMHDTGTTVVRINEVEAYLGVQDPACHTFGGRRTSRTETMWGAAGRAYIYLVYGIHHCLNVVTVGEGAPEAVLIRGAEIVQGRDAIQTRRGAGVPERSLTDGPGKLCRALAITRAEDGLDLCSSGSMLSIRDDGFDTSVMRVRRLPRVGVDYAGDAAAWPLRYVSESRV
ncbi:MAG: DNA-3-methyladenine glycosylase [Thermoanaerobaculales bacterium]|nr:DNA-3-methyladenine glycosylase [Thermoanaerobaculales bacterium]